MFENGTPCLNTEFIVWIQNSKFKYGISVFENGNTDFTVQNSEIKQEIVVFKCEIADFRI